MRKLTAHTVNDANSDTKKDPLERLKTCTTRIKSTIQSNSTATTGAATIYSNSIQAKRLSLRPPRQPPSHSIVAKEPPGLGYSKILAINWKKSNLHAKIQIYFHSKTLKVTILIGVLQDQIPLKLTLAETQKGLEVLASQRPSKIVVHVILMKPGSLSTQTSFWNEVQSFSRQNRIYLTMIILFSVNFS